MKPAETYQFLAETFKALADPTRVGIIHILDGRELCVCDIQEILGMTQSAVSHQLRVLRNLRLVKYRKAGRSVFYSLDDKHISNMFLQCLEHVEERSLLG
jgi:ArsR family transcriptional regulator